MRLMTCIPQVGRGLSSSVSPISFCPNLQESAFQIQTAEEFSLLFCEALIGYVSTYFYGNLYQLTHYFFNLVTSFSKFIFPEIVFPEYLNVLTFPRSVEISSMSTEQGTFRGFSPMKEAEPPSEALCFPNQNETMENMQNMFQFNDIIIISDASTVSLYF
jgi:hypothetical protein